MESKKQINSVQKNKDKQQEKESQKTNFNKNVKSIFFEITNQHKQGIENNQTQEEKFDIQNHKTLKNNLQKKSQQLIPINETISQNDQRLQYEQECKELENQNLKDQQVENLEKRFLIQQNQQLQKALIGTRNLLSKSDLQSREQIQQLKQIPILEDQINKLRDNNNIQSNQLHELQKQLQRIQQNEKTKEQYDELLQQQNCQKIQILDQQKKIDILNKENNLLKSNFSDFQQLQQELQDENEQLVLTNKTILLEKSQFQNSFSQQLKQILKQGNKQQTQVSIEDIENKFNDQINIYEKRLFALQSQLKDQESLQNFMNTLQQKNFDLQQKNQDLTIQLQDYLEIQQSNEKLLMKVQLYEQENQQIQTICTDYSNKIQQLQQEMKKIEQSSKKDYVDQQKIEELINNIQNDYINKQQSNETIIQVQELNSELKRLQIENKKLVQQNQLNEIKNQSQENFIKSLEQQILQKNDIQENKKIKNLQNQIQQLYNKIEQLQNENLNLKIDNDEYNKTCEQNRSLSKQNEQNKFNMEELLKRLTKAEHQALNSQQHKNRSKFFEQEYLRLKSFYENNQPKIQKTEQRKIKNITIRKEIQ